MARVRNRGHGAVEAPIEAGIVGKIEVAIVQRIEPILNNRTIQMWIVQCRQIPLHIPRMSPMAIDEEEEVPVELDIQRKSNGTWAIGMAKRWFIWEQRKRKNNISNNSSNSGIPMKHPMFYQKVTIDFLLHRAL